MKRFGDYVIDSFICISVVWLDKKKLDFCYFCQCFGKGITNCPIEIPISIRYGKSKKSQNAYLNLVWKKCKNHKMSISIRNGKTQKSQKCLSQLGMEKTQKSQNYYLN